MIVFGPRANKRNHGSHCMAQEIAHCPFFSEIDASVERYCPVSSRRRDPAERRGIDVQVRVTPDRPVQDIDCVGAKCEQSIFAPILTFLLKAISKPKDAGPVMSGIFIAVFPVVPCSGFFRMILPVLSTT